MRVPAALVSLLVFVGGQQVVAADNATTGARLGRLVAPFVDERTLLVAHLDLMAFAPLQTVDWLADRFGLAQAVRDKLQANAVLASVLTQTLPPDSNVDVFVVVSLSDLGHVPLFVVLPAAERGAASAIAVEVRRELEKSWRRPVQTARFENALVTGSPETIERLQHDLPVARPELEAALGAAGDSALRIAFVPGAELRHFAAILLRRLTNESRGETIARAVAGVSWGAVGVQLAPERFSIRAIIQANDASAAKILRQEFAALAELLAGWDARNAALRADEERERLLPVVEGDRLILELDEDDHRLEDLGKLFAPWGEALVRLIGR